jgi:hypothetical protein
LEQRRFSPHCCKASPLAGLFTHGGLVVLFICISLRFASLTAQNSNTCKYGSIVVVNTGGIYVQNANVSLTNTVTGEILNAKFRDDYYQAYTWDSVPARFYVDLCSLKISTPGWTDYSQHYRLQQYHTGYAYIGRQGDEAYRDYDGSLVYTHLADHLLAIRREGLNAGELHRLDSLLNVFHWHESAATADSLRATLQPGSALLSWNYRFYALPPDTSVAVAILILKDGLGMPDEYFGPVLSRGLTMTNQIGFTAKSGSWKQADALIREKGYHLEVDDEDGCTFLCYASIRDVYGSELFTICRELEQSGFFTSVSPLLIPMYNEDQD